MRIYALIFTVSLLLFFTILAKVMGFLLTTLVGKTIEIWEAKNDQISELRKCEILTGIL